MSLHGCTHHIEKTALTGLGTEDYGSTQALKGAERELEAVREKLLALTKDVSLARRTAVEAKAELSAEQLRQQELSDKTADLADQLRNTSQELDYLCRRNGVLLKIGKKQEELRYGSEALCVGLKNAFSAVQGLMMEQEGVEELIQEMLPPAMEEGRGIILDENMMISYLSTMCCVHLIVRVIVMTFVKMSISFLKSCFKIKLQARDEDHHDHVFMIFLVRRYPVRAPEIISVKAMSCNVPP